MPLLLATWTNMILRSPSPNIPFGILRLPPWPWDNGTAQPSLKVRPEPPISPSPPACDIRGAHYHSISPFLILSPPLCLVRWWQGCWNRLNPTICLLPFPLSQPHITKAHTLKGMYSKNGITLWNIKWKHFKCWWCINLNQNVRGELQPWR